MRNIGKGGLKESLRPKAVMVTGEIPFRQVMVASKAYRITRHVGGGMIMRVPTKMFEASALFNESFCMVALTSDGNILLRPVGQGRK